MEALPVAFLAHAPRLERVGLSADALTTLPADFLTEVPRLRTAMDRDWAWHLPNLIQIGPRVLADAAQLEQFSLYAPNLKFIGADFLARAPRLSAFTLNMVPPTPFVPSPLSTAPGGLLYDGPPWYQLHHRPALFVDSGFLAGAQNLQTVRLKTELGSDIELRPAADFLADLPRMDTVRLDMILRDPPPPGFLRGTSMRDLRLHVRIAADMQNAPRLPAVVQAETWRLNLSCDSTYPPAWFVPFQAAPPRALTLIPCASVRLPPTFLPFLQGLPPSTRLRLDSFQQLARADYAALPVSALNLDVHDSSRGIWVDGPEDSNINIWMGWVPAAIVQIHGNPASVSQPDNLRFNATGQPRGVAAAHVSAATGRVPVLDAPRADAPVLGYLPTASDIRYPVLGWDGEPPAWWLIPFNFLAAAPLAEIRLYGGAALRWPVDPLANPALRRAMLHEMRPDFALGSLRADPALEALHLDLYHNYSYHPLQDLTDDETLVPALAAQFDVPALLLDMYSARDESFHFARMDAATRAADDLAATTRPAGVPRSREDIFALHSPRARGAAYSRALAAWYPSVAALDTGIAALLRAPPARVRHLGLRAPLAALRPVDVPLGTVAQAAVQDYRELLYKLRPVAAPLATVASCLHLALPHLEQPPSDRLRAAARRHNLDLDLVPLASAARRQPAYWEHWETDREDPYAPFFYRSADIEWQINAADYFQQRHLPWATAHACSRSLLLIDRRLAVLPHDFLDQPGPIQRVRLAFDPLRCPACQPEPSPVQAS